MKSSDLIRILKDSGFVFDRQAKGSHEIWYHPQNKRRTVVPNHGSKEIPTGTLKAILKAAGIKIKK